MYHPHKVQINTPIHLLPTEILIDIFRLACQEDGTRVVNGHPLPNVSISLTCSHFRRIILELCDVWTTIDFRLHWPLRVLTSYVTTILKRTGGMALNIVVRDGWRSISSPNVPPLFQRLFTKVTKVDTISFYISQYTLDYIPEMLLNNLPVPPRRLEIHHAAEFDTRPLHQARREPKDEKKPIMCPIRSCKYIDLVEELDLVDTSVYLDWLPTTFLSLKSFTQRRRLDQTRSSASIHGDYVFRRCPNLQTVTFEGRVHQEWVNWTRLPNNKFTLPLHTLTITDHQCFIDFCMYFPDLRVPRLQKFTVETHDAQVLSEFLTRHPTITDLTLPWVMDGETIGVVCPRVARLSIPSGAVQLVLYQGDGAGFKALKDLHIDCTAYSLSVDEFEDLVEMRVLCEQNELTPQLSSLSLRLPQSEQKSKQDWTRSAYAKDAVKRWEGDVCYLS